MANKKINIKYKVSFQHNLLAYFLLHFFSVSLPVYQSVGEETDAKEEGKKTAIVYRVPDIRAR